MNNGTKTTFQRVNELEGMIKDLRGAVNHLSEQSQRIDTGIEALISQASDAINKLAERLHNQEKALSQLTAIRDYVRGLSKIAGEDAVNEAVAKIQKEDIDAQSAKIRAAVDEGVKLGRLKQSDKIVEGCLVLVEETTPRGTYNTFLELSRMPEDFQKEFLGKEAGFQKQFDEKGSWVIKEIYTVVLAAEQETPATQ